MLSVAKGRAQNNEEDIVVVFGAVIPHVRIVYRSLKEDYFSKGR